MITEARQFSMLNTRLGKLEINYFGVREAIIRKKKKQAVVITVLLILVGLLLTLKHKFIGGLVGLVLSLPLWIHTFEVSRYEPMQFKCNKLITDYLNKPLFMVKLLEAQGSVYNISSIADIDISNATKEDFNILEKHILRYKLERTLPILVILSVVLGIGLSSIFRPFNLLVFDIINNILMVSLLLICTYYIISAFTDVVYEIIFKNFKRQIDKCYHLGALSELHYKLISLYYSEYMMEGLFSLEDYEYFLDNEIIERNSLIIDYINDCNFKRTRGVLAFGLIGVLILAYSPNPILVIIPVVLACVLALVFRVKVNGSNIDKYEEKLTEKEATLTAKIMKYIPNDFLNNL